MTSVRGSLRLWVVPDPGARAKATKVLEGPAIQRGDLAAMPDERRAGSPPRVHPRPALSRPRPDAIVLLMAPRAQKLLEEALELSTTERADLAAELLASLPPGSALDEENPDAEWSTEVERRAREAQADPDGGVPWETVRDEISRELRARR